MGCIAKFALAYWAGIFALGFVLGTARVVWLSELIGETPAVLAELPVMIAASWLWARRLLARWPLPDRGQALAAGALAFALLMGAEATLGVAAFGERPGEWSASLLRPPGLYGLAGQLVFALMPWWIARR